MTTITCKLPEALDAELEAVAEKRGVSKSEVVRMSELYPGLPVFTLDTDFRVYRKNGRQRIETIMPA
jgi:hypothetical protein